MHANKREYLRSYFSFRRILILGWVAIGLVACTHQPPSRTAAPAAVAPGEASRLFGMTAGAFRASGAAETPLNGRRPDQALLSAAIFHETNVRRQRAGRSVLGHDARLDRAARLHAGQMVAEGFFDHINPRRATLRTPKDRVLSTGFNPMYISENISTHFDLRYQDGRGYYRLPAAGGISYTPNGPPIARHTYRSFAVSLLDQWMASPGHRANILSRYPTRFGAGCVLRPGSSSGLDKLYCVQLFGAEKA